MCKRVRRHGWKSEQEVEQYVYTMCDVIKLEVKSGGFLKSLHSKSLQSQSLQSQSLHSIQSIKNIWNTTSRHVQDKYEMWEDRNSIEFVWQIHLAAREEIQMSVSLKGTMLAFGLLLLCLSAAVTGYEHQVPFKFEVRPKTQQVAEMYLLGQRHEDVRSATAKASSNQRHYLHQQHPWGLRVQTNGK